MRRDEPLLQKSHTAPFSCVRNFMPFPRKGAMWTEACEIGKNT
jgi:hypothetical protein